MEGVKAMSELDKLRRLDCLRLAVQADGDACSDGEAIVHMADAFYQFVDKGTVPAAEADDED